MSRVFWDTNLFIYLLEGHGEFAQATRALRDSMNRRGDQLFTSALVLGEILVKPVESGQPALAVHCRRIIEEVATVIPFDAVSTSTFARARAQNVRAPDAVHLACAATAGVDLFITNDHRLHAVHLDGIHFIVPLSRAPL